MKRIIIHWTAGSWTPCQTDKNSYHFVVDGTGRVYSGKYKPEDNEDCSDGKYAKHTGGGNTGSIGIAVCAMYSDSYPITRPQIEALFKKCAELCKQYHIPITPQTVMTHYEFGKAHPNTTSKGKIDITKIAPFPKVTPGQCGDFIRSKIMWYYKEM